MADAKAVRLNQAKTLAWVVLPLCLWAIVLELIPYSASFDLFLKIVIWGIPAYLLPRILDNTNPIEFLLLNEPPKWTWVFLSTAFLVVYSVLMNLGKVEVKSVSFFYILSAVVISPIVEEIAFRGVILQKFSQMVGLAYANVISTATFLLYHVPLWLARGQGISLLGCLWIVFFSLSIGYILSRSKSLWTCVIIHAVQNLIFGIL